MNAQRLSKTIQGRESVKVQNYLLGLYEKMTKKQKSALKIKVNNYKNN